MSSSLPKAWRANEGGRLGWGTVPSGHNVSGIIVGDKQRSSPGAVARLERQKSRNKKTTLQ